jgi:hypothetical protein
MTHAHGILTALFGVLAVCAALALGLSRFVAQPAPKARLVLADLSGAASVEILDASNRPMLHGLFQVYPAQTADLLKAAQLVASEGVAVGKVEIELVRHPNGVLVQELEVDVDGLPGEAVFSVVIDGTAAGGFRTDISGAAEFERYGRVTATAGGRLHPAAIGRNSPAHAPLVALDSAGR